MIASLYQRSFATFGWTSIFESTFTAQLVSGFAAEQQRRIVGRVDCQADAAPFDGVAFAIGEIDDGAHWAAVVVRPDGDIAEMKPECARSMAIQCNRHGDGVVAAGGFLDEADHFAVIDLREAQVS